MTYTYPILEHFARTGERAEDFAARAGVSRSSVYRVRTRQVVGLDSIRLMLRAIGYDLVISYAFSATPAKRKKKSRRNTPRQMKESLSSEGADS